MDTLSTLRRYGLRPQRAKGQHFLIDKRFIEREAEYAGVDKKDTVLEIGSGVGNLTEVLARRAKKVMAIEKSLVFVKILKDLGLENVEVIHGDALKLTLPSYDKCVSNIPYQISSGITEMVLKGGKTSVICYQREFALRLLARPGSEHYSRLSVLAMFYSEPKILEEAPRGLFYPPPKVDSLLVRLVPKEAPFPADDFFWTLVKACFMHKGQVVRNALSHSSAFVGLEKARIKNAGEEVFRKKAIDCSLEDFRKIREAFS